MYILYTIHQEHSNIGYVHLLVLSIDRRQLKKINYGLQWRLSFGKQMTTHPHTINNSNNLYLKKTLIFTKLIQITRIFNNQVFSP